MADREDALAAEGKWFSWRQRALDELDDMDPKDPSTEYERVRAQAWLQHCEREYDEARAAGDKP